MECPWYGGNTICSVLNIETPLYGCSVLARYTNRNCFNKCKQIKLNDFNLAVVLYLLVCLT